MVAIGAAAAASLPRPGPAGLADRWAPLTAAGGDAVDDADEADEDEDSDGTVMADTSADEEDTAGAAMAAAGVDVVAAAPASLPTC